MLFFILQSKEQTKIVQEIKKKQKSKHTDVHCKILNEKKIW